MVRSLLGFHSREPGLCKGAGLSGGGSRPEALDAADTKAKVKSGGSQSGSHMHSCSHCKDFGFSSKRNRDHRMVSAEDLLMFS